MLQTLLIKIRDTLKERYEFTPATKQAFEAMRADVRWEVRCYCASKCYGYSEETAIYGLVLEEICIGGRQLKDYLT